jgi:hypothetical protein
MNLGLLLSRWSCADGLLCDIACAEIVDFDGEASGWNIPSVSKNARVSRPAYCGRYGLSISQDEPGPDVTKTFTDTINFGTGVSVPGYVEPPFNAVPVASVVLMSLHRRCRYGLLQYPVMCMAYRIPATTIVTMVVNITGVGERNIAMTASLANSSLPTVARWSLCEWSPLCVDFASPHSGAHWMLFALMGYDVVVDGRWHFACLDVGSQARDALFLEGISLSSEHRVLSLRFGAPATTTTQQVTQGDFWIDELSVSSLVCMLLVRNLLLTAVG